MKINEYNGAMKWIGRKKPTNKERADVLQWIDHNNGMYGTEEQHKEYKKKYATVANKYDESEDPRYVPPAEMEDIKKELKVSPMVKQPNKIIKKEIKVVEKPAKPKPLLPEWDWRLSDWRDLFDEDAPSPPAEDIEKVLNIKKKEVAGLEALLNLHKKFVG